MERIKFDYHFEDQDHGAEHDVTSYKYDKNDCGLQCYDICEMFVDFMTSAGFSEQNIWDYFRED
jgi:hypothetical protein